MPASKVYFTDMRCKVGDSLLDKLNRLIQKAGIEQIDFNQKYVAIKIHFGEPGNLAFLRPNFAKVVADKIKALGGKPFLTDSNTLYVGRRNNALVHMDAAFENGYSPLSTGCQNIIADGLKGTDDVDVPVPGGIYCKTAKIGRAIMDADIVISLNHFKGHEGTGFGGALKNLGMGSGSRGGKMIMHNDGKPTVDQNECTGCKGCTKFCNQNAILFDAAKKAGTAKAVIDHNLCVGCGRCIGACNFHAISNDSSSSNAALNCKIAEFTQAVVHGRPNFHINVVNQVSPYCDCHGESDAPIVPDIGIFAGFDPVALDKACIDAVNAAPAIATSIISEREQTHKDSHGHADHLTDIHPTTDWQTQISHAEKIGLGSGTYELITVK
ncbi:4Fe-4S ferredoxin [Spirochaetia bacterium]|nr:4Fe-4S ferredoxin [Spirochaetia bacterium]